MELYFLDYYSSFFKHDFIFNLYKNGIEFQNCIVYNISGGEHCMIKRTILKEIELSVKSRPVTLITGARQVGKSTLAQLFMKDGFSYVSLDNSRERELAKKDPNMFLELHPWPLIIDEVQRAPELFEAIEEIVNREKMSNPRNYGMYIITGSQMYKLMNNVTESMAGRVSIIHMVPLSRSEILDREERVFDFNIKEISKRALANPLSVKSLFKDIVHGYYPELYSNELLTSEKFYSDYVESYIERDVSDMLNVKDKFAFRRFMELMASLTGEELVYDNISKIIGVDNKTINAWISFLIAGDIIYLLEPYSEFSITKRISKRPKVYFTDTGLASYLVKINSAETLESSFLGGRFVETYIINELRKSYLNNGKNPNFYYYRDNNMNEIDLIIIEDGKMHRIECKSGIKFNMSSVKGFKQVENTNYKLSLSGIICNTDAIYPLDENIYVIPIAGI